VVALGKPLLPYQEFYKAEDQYVIDIDTDLHMTIHKNNITDSLLYEKVKSYIEAYIHVWTTLEASFIQKQKQWFAAEP
jgi:hypothetical protein